MKILITGGGSQEPIDNVRCITNFSTGKTASFIADWFSENLNDLFVTLLTSCNAILPKNQKINLVFYKTFNELKENLENLCKINNFDFIIHAAAVSDFSPEKIIVDKKEFIPGSFTKIPSGSELTIKMKKNPKLIESIKTWNKKNCILVGFKLTSNALEEEKKLAVQKMFFDKISNKNSKSLKNECNFVIKNGAPDFVISNDLSQITKQKHPCKIFSVKNSDSEKNIYLEKEVQNLNELCEFFAKKLETI